MENKEPKQNKELAEREAEATEKETLDDLQDSFGDSKSQDENTGSVPSPDGAFDQQNELKEADPN
jgi:hypothetical protein